MNIKSVIRASLLTANLLASDQVQTVVDDTNKELLRSLLTEEVAGYKIYKPGGRINEDIRGSIVKVGKQIEDILPKGVKMNGNEQDVRLFYQVRF